jgi:dynein heavy chain
MDLQPLEHFSMMAENVYLPLIEHSASANHWPDVLSKELMVLFQKMVGKIALTIGEKNGTTHLPLPPDENSRLIDEKDRIFYLENCVVQWTAQIKQIMQADPEEKLKEGVHVGPEYEVEFWRFKAANLNAIQDQLKGHRVQNVLAVLEDIKNTYVPVFLKLMEDVAVAAEEANENVKFLGPLEPHLNRLRDADEFTDLTKVFALLMHNILLVWKHSDSYSSPSRLVVLMREICNTIIKKANDFLEPETILEDEPQDAVDKLKAALKVVGTMKTVYFGYKARVALECPNNPWRFQNSALFVRLDSFLERCHDILELCNTVLQFSKLETVEVGGTKGRILTTSVAQIFSDFTQAITKFHHIDYVLADVEADKFDDDFYVFRVAIKELERRLGSVVTQGFDDCPTVYSRFKLLDSFDVMLQREVIMQDLEKKHVDLVQTFGKDLKVVLEIFRGLKDHPIIGRNMPPVAGAVSWVRGLKERIQDPYERFKTLHASAVMESEETKEVFKIYNLAIALFEEFEQKQFGGWCEAIESIGQDKLKQSLLVRYTDGGFDGKGKGLPLLRVNFDPALIKLLREVRYLKLLSLEVPATALAIYEKNETFRQQIGNLELLANVYNKILMSLKHVEKPMLQQKMDKIDEELKKGSTVLTWKSHGINEFIVQTMALVKDASDILIKINANVDEMEVLLQQMKENIMFERKDQRCYSVEDFQFAHETVIADRHASIMDAGEKIHSLLLASNKVLRISKGAASWKAYQDYVAGIVINGLSMAAKASMEHLKNQLTEEYLAKNDISPLLELKLELVANDILYTPSVGGAHGNELRTTVLGWVKDFLNVAKFVARLDTGEGDYLYEIDEDLSIVVKVQEMNALLDRTQADCQAFAAGYEKFAYLWMKDIDACFEEFMVTRPDEEGAEAEDDQEEAAIWKPSLALFDSEIAKYNDIQDEVSALPNNHVMQWLKVDAKPIKQAISSWVGRWRYKYTQHLLDELTNSISDLLQFVGSASVTLEKEVPDGDKDALIDVMGCLRDVRARQEATEAMFDPLRDTVALLKKWGVPIDDDTMAGLDDAPQKWNTVRKQFFTTKERLAPMQDAEAKTIRGRADAFAEEVATFREKVKTQGPFEYGDKWAAAFEILHNFDGEIIAMEAQGNEINEMQDLFEITVTPFREISASRREIVNLKSVWDMVSMLVTTFAEYRAIKWAEINTDELTDQCKKLSKIVKSLDKFVKNWNVYKGCEDTVKNMMTSLPLVADLAHPSMRDRHWKQLMRATGKNFTKDDSFTLGNLLQLGLHNFVEEVGEIVDRAQKELLIEKQLAKIEDTWSTLTVEYAQYGESEVMLLQLPEELVEALDDGQVQLQALAGNKYVAGNSSFMDMVSLWQGKLGAVDTTVRNSWLEVQGKWTSLEPIFIGSADIRVQLPEDSKRFDGIDGTWKEMMKEAVETTDPIEAAQAEGRQEALDSMLKDLELCEKSLNDYLETKKAAFPRFYFVAPADLLDILSKGSSPWLLQKHFSKNFDSINALRFEKNEDESPSKNALGMVSPQNEYVQFHEPLLCEGAVEVWLNKVMDWMRLALRNEQAIAYKTYEDEPRHKWQLGQCAQMAVLVSRIIYTDDVGKCFEKLEDGDDNALKDYMDQCQTQLGHLSDLINGELAKGDRKKTITMVTIDVHGRDVIGRLISARVEDVGCFEWQSQLRYGVREGDGECFIKICDFDEPYTYEYIGNCGALVITPLTDRCYITLTQASLLVLGGAPAGPAGTGKTETTKDLGRALGIMVYVFNCSDQMDFRVMANIYKGLAQTGCWGCFDEFNRITIEVLSVCSTQYKMVLDGIRQQGLAGGRELQPTFVFDEEDVPLFKTCMAFITMNPGYAGRTELPESLKALFRPVSMVVPDMVLICEIMLFSEGFVSCKLLARKFMLCYNLATDLLSKAMHYDWKLRAVKTTLCVAGSMKRAAPELSEDKVLLRALRDFNLGKLLRDDIGIFMGLLNDLFPKTLELVPRAVFPDFEDVVKQCTLDKGFQPDEMFIQKITQLREIFEVRWSVFLLGPAGCGKTVVAEILMDSQNKFGERGMIKVHNPKAVTRNELYGFVSMATREWNDGLLSQLFRDYSNDSSYQHQWIILDGDIDAEWIETMNTVMDDNKILTLVSGERIPLTPPMRLLFEIADLRNASPATVSRAGVIYINDDDIGWMPFAQTWLETRPDESQRAFLSSLINNYVPKALLAVLKNFRLTVPIVQINSVCTLCYLLDGVLGQGEDMRKGLSNEVIETYFVWCCVWAFGGGLLVDKANDFKDKFSKWWMEEFKTIKFPSDGNVFDYTVDEKTCALVDWDCESYIHTPGEPVANLYVDIPETARLSFIFRLLVEKKRGIMFVGGAGTGKTVCMQQNIKALDEDNFVYSLMNLNSKTDSMTLQNIMESQLEKKAGITFGPPGNKTIVYYIDDLNMPFVDKYGTQEPIAFLRCFVDYELMYEREKLGPRKVQNCNIVASLNPTAGSFVVDGRFQRQFATFSCQLPKTSSLMSIYGNIFNNHLSDFDAEIAEVGKAVTAAAGELQSMVANTFLPSAVKFHYIFNLRDISNVFGGLLRCEARFCSGSNVLVEMFLHEANRVYRDRMVSETDLRRFDDMLTEISKRHFGTIEGCEDVLEKTPLIFTDFCANTGDDNKPYLGVKSWEQLNKVLQDQLNEHNETNAVMNLVLFQDAMEHVSRIARIVGQPRGNALLVGVGGSGKQSLARLAAYICQYEVYQVKISSAYNTTAFLEDLQIMYKRAGVKGIGILFLFTDQQIVDETFLVYLNDMLSSGDIPGLFPNEDVDDICNSVRNEVKQAGLIDTRDACWDFFIQKVRRYLHTALAFSPVGDKFRIRAREFPALLSGTMIDWFHAWSTEALISVANRFLAELPMLDEEVQENLANHMALVHNSVTEGSTQFFETQRRYNYTTPKSFLELIALYKSMLNAKFDEIDVLKERLESGLEKLQATSEMVAELQDALVGEQALVEEKKAATDALLVHVGQETSVAEEQKAGAAVEEEGAAEIAAEVAAVQADANKELEAAEPIIQAAEAALNSLDKGSLGELKGFGSPAEAVVKVTSATIILTAGKPKVPKDVSWAAAKKMMGNVGAFLDGLISFDKDNVDEVLVEKCEKVYISDPEFDVDSIRNKSSAAAGLCGWCINICKYFRIYQMVAPKRAMLAAANAKLDGANTKLAGIRAMLAELDAKLGKLTDQFESATAEKNAAIAQAEKTQAKADLATRLVNGLSSEGVRWAASIESFGVRQRTLIGDVMLASAFVSYTGAFTADFRSSFVNEKWLPDMADRQIPMTDGVKPVEVLATESQIAGWNNDNLPSDMVSVQNGAIICNSARWPLMIDPQLQGILWISEREKENNLTVVQLTQHKYIDKVENAMTQGETIIIENMGDAVDPVLDPVLARAVIKKGRSLIIKLGDKEVDYDPKFQLYLQTKLANPHYIPEVQAQCTLVNFTVTEKGLEDQLLALVVKFERSDLEEQRSALIRAENGFKVQLQELEDNLLQRLATQEGDILEDIELIENLEETKVTSLEIQKKVAEGKETAKVIDTSREVYRPVAARGSLMYFLVDKLNQLEHMYQYSMANFVDILTFGMIATPASEDLKKRIDSVSSSTAMLALIAVHVVPTYPQYALPATTNFLVACAM